MILTGETEVSVDNLGPVLLFQTQNLQKIFVIRIAFWDKLINEDEIGVGVEGNVARRMELEIHRGFWMGNLKITIVICSTVADLK